MRRTGNKDENKRILMDLDVVLKSHDCPYIIQCYGAIVTNVSNTHMVCAQLPHTESVACCFNEWICFIWYFSLALLLLKMVKVV